MSTVELNKAFTAAQLSGCNLLFSNSKNNAGEFLATVSLSSFALKSDIPPATTVPTFTDKTVSNVIMTEIRPANFDWVGTVVDMQHNIIAADKAFELIGQAVILLYVEGKFLSGSGDDRVTFNVELVEVTSAGEISTNAYTTATNTIQFFRPGYADNMNYALPATFLFYVPARGNMKYTIRFKVTEHTNDNTLRLQGMRVVIIENRSVTVKG